MDKPRVVHPRYDEGEKWKKMKEEKIEKEVAEKYGENTVYLFIISLQHGSCTHFLGFGMQTRRFFVLKTIGGSGEQIEQQKNPEVA